MNTPRTEEEKKICLLCNLPLTFTSSKKGGFGYHKICFKTLKKLGNVVCHCGGGFLRNCYWQSCPRKSERCATCQQGWIDEYCSWCR